MSTPSTPSVPSPSPDIVHLCTGYGDLKSSSCKSMDQVSIVWTLKDFADIYADPPVGTKIISPTFTALGGTWRFHLFPCGQTKISKSHGKLAFFIGNAGSNVVKCSRHWYIVNGNGICKWGEASDEDIIRPKKTMGRRSNILLSTILNSPSKYLCGNDLVFHCQFAKISPDRHRHPEETMAAHMKNLLQQGTMSDVVLKVGDESFRAHRMILSARSPVFKSMFSIGMRETTDREVTIPEMDSHIFRQLLNYMYTDECEDILATSCEIKDKEKEKDKTEDKEKEKDKDRDGTRSSGSSVGAVSHANGSGSGSSKGLVSMDIDTDTHSVPSTKSPVTPTQETKESQESKQAQEIKREKSDDKTRHHWWDIANSGEVRHLQVLMAGAHRFQLTNLVSRCAKELSDRLTGDNAFSMLALADLFHLDSFKTTIFEFLTKDASVRAQAMQTEEFQNLGPELLQQFLVALTPGAKTGSSKKRPRPDSKDVSEPTTKKTNTMGGCAPHTPCLQGLD